MNALNLSAALFCFGMFLWCLKKDKYPLVVFINLAFSCVNLYLGLSL